MAKLNSTIFKQETIQSWFSGVNASINNEVIQPFQNAEQVIWKYNQAIQHNSLTQQGWERLLAQSDDSLKTYLTSIKGSSASMTGYNVALQGNITGLKKVSSAITQYNVLSASGSVEQNTFATAVSTTNSRLGTYLTGLNGANASLGGYIISLVGATAKTVLLKVATIALNTAVTMGASLIISGIVSAISKWINKTENMIEASEDAVEKIKSINEELKNNQKTISDTAKRYAELAQGVDQLTGKNISLSSEDYEEFLSLSNQLAEMFPTLTRNYNDNGDAIVQLSGDVDTIVGSLQNLIEAQRDLTNRQIVDELPTVFDGVAEKSDTYEQELSALESKRDALVKSLGDVQSEEFSNNFMDGFSNKWIEISGDNLEVISQMKDDYVRILEDANIDYEELTPTYEMKDGVEVPVGFTIKINSSDEEVEKAKNTIDEKIEDLAKTYAKDIEKLNNEINIANEKNKANWTSLSNSIYAWLSTDDSFKVMDDTMQATVQNIVNSLDWGNLNFSSWEDAKQYIQDNILSLFNAADGKEVLADIQVMFGIQTQFNNGDITVEQYQTKLQEFLSSIESLPPESKKSIMLLFGVETNEDGTTTSSVDTMIANVKEKLKGTEFENEELNLGSLTLDELEIATTISTEEFTKAIEEEKKKVEDGVFIAQENLQDEYALIEKWGLGDYAEQIKNGTIQSVFGNVDMDKRTIITWSDELKQTYQDELDSWGYDPEIGGIDTVFGGSDRFGESLSDNGWEVAFTPILPDGTFLSKDTVYDYIEAILQQAYADDGKVTDEELKTIDAQGMQIGDTFVKGIYAGIDSGSEYDNNGNWADTVGRLMHFSGDFGAVNLAKQGVDDAKKRVDDVGVYTANALARILNDAKAKTNDFSNETEILGISKTIDQLNTKLKPAMDSLASAYQSIFTSDGFTLKDVGVDMLSSIKKEIDELNSNEELGISIDYSSFEEFSEVLSDTSSSSSEVQKQFNKLATEIVYATSSTEVTSENFTVLSKALTEIGLTNANEVLNQLVDVQNEYREISEQLGYTLQDLANATYEETTQMLIQAQAAGLDSSSLFKLAVAQGKITDGTINSESNVEALLAEAQAAGLDLSVLTALENVRNGNIKDTKSAQAILDNAKKQIISSMSEFKLDFDFSPATKSAGKAGKDAGEAYKEAFEKELSELQDLRDRGVIDEKEYLDRLRALYIRYFADRKEYLDEYNKYEHEYLTGMKSLYDSALSGITKLMSNKIDAVETEKEATITALEEERDARLEVIDAQKEQLQAEIDLIDEQIEAKQDVIDSIQDEIDRMREANEERKRATDLQKAQYELERMMNQRTQLVYQGGQMVYKSDDEGIRDAREAVDDAKLEIEIAAKEKEIALIEDEINLLEKQKEAIQDQIDALDKQADSIEEYYSKMISQQEKYYDSLIKNMEEQKSKWEELAEVQEIAEAYAAVQQVFGELGYTVEDVLNGSSGAFEDFKEKYIGLMSDLNSTSSFADGLSYATDVAKEDLGSFLDKTQDVAQGLDDLSAKGEGLNAVSNAMNSANTSASELKTSTDGLNDNLSGISDSLTSIPSSEGINGWVTGFTELGEAIKGVAQALGIAEEGTVGSLVTALQDINNVSLGTEEEGVIGQFGLLKKAVDDVSSAISGGGSNGGENGISGDASNSKSASMSSGANGEGASGLLGAIEEIGTKTNETLGETSEEEGGSGVIGKFTELKNAVDLVTQSIGTSEEEEGEETTTLIGALQKQYEKAQLVLPEEKTLFDEILSSIQACVAALIEMASAIETMPAISGGGISVGVGHAEGTVGKAFANGTGKYKGLPHAEKNAMRSEYGQPELTVYPNGVAELTTEPTMSDLPKGTEIFNEEQTRRIMNNKGKVVGKAFASGTIQNPDGSIILPDGSVCSPLPDDHPINVFFRDWEKKHMDFNESMMTPMHSIQDNISEMARNINNISTKNNQNQQINIGDINVNCPGITSQEVAQQVSNALHREIGGIALEALQESSITR